MLYILHRGHKIFRKTEVKRSSKNVRKHWFKQIFSVFQIRTYVFILRMKSLNVLQLTERELSPTAHTLLITKYR